MGQIFTCHSEAAFNPYLDLVVRSRVALKQALMNALRFDCC
jgi:hypothetical protein